MMRINKTEIEKAARERLFIQLDKSLSKLPALKIGIFLEGLLGVEERLMLAKRLAVILMLARGCSLYRIAHTLKISTATANRINQKSKEGHYTKLLALVRKNKTDYLAILKIIDSMLTAGGLMPHRVGLDRYRHLT